MNSDKIIDGGVMSYSKAIYPFYEVSWEKDGNFERMLFFISILLRNLKFLPICLSIKNSGINLQL